MPADPSDRVVGRLTGEKGNIEIPANLLGAGSALNVNVDVSATV